MSARIMGLALVAAAVALPAGAQAPELQDGRWLPYLGCWVEEDAAAGPMTCVVPEARGVAFLTVAEGETTDRRVVRGDAVPSPVDADGCTGTESMRFSGDGHRLFTEAQLACGGAERHTRGLIAMIEPDRWVEVRALAGPGGQSVAWATRYAPAPAARVAAAGLSERVATPARTVETARVAASSTMGVDAIIEANARTDPEAVRTWIVEQGDPIRLDAERLIQLADAGVPASVIDVAVAVSFPDRFAVDRQPRPEHGARSDYGYGRRAGAWRLWSPWGGYYDPFGYRYDPYGYGRFGYYGYGAYPYSYGYGPSGVVVRPVTGTPSGGGRMVKGRGYVPSGSSSGTATGASLRTQPAAGARTSSSSSSGSKGKAKRRGSGGG